MPLQNKFETAITGTIIENPSFYSDIRRFGWPSYTSVVVINVWLCCLTGYVLRRRKKYCFDPGGSEEYWPVRQQDVLKSLRRWRSLADRSGMVLGVVCGLRKEYTTLGNWLKA